MNDWIKLLVKYKGKCAACNNEISAGQYALWSRSSKAIKHIECKAITRTPKKREEYTSRPQPAEIEVDCFICSRPIGYTDYGFEEVDYDRRAVSQACICNSCLEDNNAYQNYKQAFIEKAYKLAKVKL
jgi:hypothetical protein